MNIKVALIGGSGFIGSRLASRLTDSGVEFRILDKRESDEYPGSYSHCDVRSLDQLRQKIEEGELLVNLAAEHRDDVSPISLYADVNVRGAENICEVAREKSVSRIIFTSTVAVYGLASPDTGEEGDISPFNEYGRTKHLAEEVFVKWQEEDPTERVLVILRPTVVFGEKNRGNVYNLLNQVSSKFFVMIGAGENIKSMAYVENVAAFIEHAMSFQPGIHLYNYVDKPDLTVERLITFARQTMRRQTKRQFRIPAALGLFIGRIADLVAGVTRRSLPISHVRVQKFLATTRFSTSVKDTGFKAPVSLEEGLRRTIEHEFNSTDQSLGGQGGDWTMNEAKASGRRPKT